MKLPIDQIQEDFLATFQAMKPGGRLVLTAPTGSGKSTRLPLWCKAAGARRVLVLEPRRVAARTLATWVAKGLGQGVGQTVGYSVRFESHHSKDTEILFVTPGVGRRLLVDGTLEDFDVVIFDEFHERSWETDALLALLAARKAGPKLIIMSATLTAEALVQRYQAEYLESQGRTFPVDIHYHDGGEQELTVPSGKHLASRCAKVVRQIWQRQSGSLLVFLPGLSSMHDVASQLGALPVVLLHGTFSQKEQSRAFDESERKIVLATNVAESSLTIPGITAVVDSGLERRQIHQSGYVALATVPVALSSADQRAGRAGRVAAGECWRLWRQAARLETSKPPDLCRMELDDLVLFFSALPEGLASKAHWMDEPPSFAWERARERLMKHRLVSASGHLTELGKTAQKLPVDQEWARVLVEAPKHLKGDLCDLCALATARRSPVKNTSSEEVAAQRKKDWGSEPWGQALALVRMGEPKKHALEGESLALCRRVSSELRQLVGAGERSKGVLRPDKELQSFLARHWSERFFLVRGKRQAWGNGQVECRLARGEDLPEDCTVAFFLQVNPTIARGLKVELQARWGLPTRVSVLREAGVGEPELSKIRWIKGVLQARVVWKHASRDLGSSEQILTGLALRRGLATLASERRWQKDVVEQMEEEQFYLKLRAELASERFDELAVPDLMERRLQELGVENCEDLELIEPEDFLQGTLDDLEREALQKDYPRTYRFGGASFSMNFEPRKKRVVMNSLSQTKGLKLNAQHLPRWNGWKVELEERGRRTILRS